MLVDVETPRVTGERIEKFAYYCTWLCAVQIRNIPLACRVFDSNYLFSYCNDD